MTLRNINFDHGSDCNCGGPGCTGVNSFANQFTGNQGPPGQQGIQGTPGKNNILVGSITDGTTDSDGADGTIGGTTVADLTAMGFNPTTTPTLVAKTDPSDAAHTKYWVRESNSWITWLTGKLKTGLLQAGTSAGQVLTWNGSVWAGNTPTYEIYNTTSVTSFSIDAILAELRASTPVTITFGVGSGLAYKFGQQIYMAQYNGGTLNTANYMTGIVMSYSGTSLQVLVTFAFGSGTPTEWLISLGALSQLPYYDAITNNGRFVQNENGILVFSDATDYIGKTDVWFLDPTTPRDGWLFCDGSQYTNNESAGKYAALYNALCWPGSPFRIDSTTFAVPNIKGKAMMGANGAEIPTIGSGTITPIGAFQQTIDPTKLPVNNPWLSGSSTLQVNGFSRSMSDSTANHNVFALDGGGSGATAISLPVTGSGATNVGGGQPLSTMNPALGMALIIKYR